MRYRITPLGIKRSMLGGPRPKLLPNLSTESAEKLALRIDSACQLADLGEKADMLVRPILLYYSCAQLCGVYTRAFFAWDCDQMHHGISCSHDAKDVKKTSITICPGQLPRLAVTCFLLSGWPNCFSPLVTYSERPTAQTGAGELLEHFGKTECGTPIGRMTLDEFVKFDFGVRLKEVRQRHGYHKFNGLPSTAFLLDVITLFVGSSLARYDPLGWRRILEGKDNEYMIHFEEAFDRYLRFGRDHLIRALHDPLIHFDQTLIRPQPSPYSSSDEIRFGNADPNQQQ